MWRWKNSKALSAGLILLAVSAPAHTASETLTSEPAGEAYNFVTHYRIQIEVPPSRVWPVLLDLESWMYEFEHASVSGTPGTAGHVSRLYEGQDFLTQVTGVVPQKMLSIANLPLTFKGEHGTGVGVFTLHENGNGTEVSLSMSRRYTAAGEGFSELRAIRQSPEFQARTREMWQERFLERLRVLAEDEDARGREELPD